MSNKQVHIYINNDINSKKTQKQYPPNDIQTSPANKYRGTAAVAVHVSPPMKTERNNKLVVGTIPASAAQTGIQLTPDPVFLR